MPTHLYSKPLNFSNIGKGHDLETQDLGASISQYIELIIFTRYGEHRYNPEFGCEIWDMDFELIRSESIWEEKLRQSLITSIVNFEKSHDKNSIGFPKFQTSIFVLIFLQVSTMNRRISVL